MSNASVGNIYHQIINEVIEASRVDFEDQGVGEEVLEELRKVCSFFPLSSLRTSSNTHKHTCTNRQVAAAVSISSARMRPLLSFIAPEHHAFRASKSVSGLDCAGLASSLAGRCWLAVLAAWAVCLQRRCRQWPVAWIAGQRAKKGGGWGSRSDRRVTGCYLGLLSSTPARKIAFATPVNLPLHFDWSQLCPPSRAPKHDTRGG